MDRGYKIESGKLNLKFKAKNDDEAILTAFELMKDNKVKHVNLFRWLPELVYVCFIESNKGEMVVR